MPIKLVYCLKGMMERNPKQGYPFFCGVDAKSQIATHQWAGPWEAWLRSSPAPLQSDSFRRRLQTGASWEYLRLCGALRGALAGLERTEQVAALNYNAVHHGSPAGDCERQQDSVRGKRIR